ncbi:hypothetical protein [Jiangella endophytica]|uniref:hypothetical protein n=1 Tax=Jiangella endophytica TaxID=1623398 RepID=UPI001300A6AD|nr:hypothetical protein [Jiangella endophytica]
MRRLVIRLAVPVVAIAGSTVALAATAPSGADSPPVPPAGELQVVLRVIDPDRDSVAPPLLPDGRGVDPVEPYGRMTVDSRDDDLEE